MLFERNLVALGRAQPSLARELARLDPVAVEPARSGEPTCRLTTERGERWLHSAYAPGREARRQAAAVPVGASAVMVVGAGLGYLPALLATTSTRLVVLEPELRLLRTMLALFDFADAIDSGRLLLMTGRDSDVAALARAPRWQATVFHPALREPYEDVLRQERFLIGLRESRGRVIVVNNKLLVADLVELLTAERFAVRLIEPDQVNLASFQALCSTVEPTLLFGINFSPELALLCSLAGLPYVSWTIDPLPRSRLRLLAGTNPSLSLTFAHRHAIVAQLRQAGLTEARYLPLAAAAGKRHVVTDPARLARYRCEVSFAGSSLAVDRNGLLECLGRAGCDDATRRRLLEWVHDLLPRARHAEYLGLAEDGSDLPGWLVDSLGGRVDPVELSDRISGALSHLLRLDRVAACAVRDVRVFGDEGWQCCGSRYAGRAEHGEELTLVYNASLVNLDVPRIYQRDIVTLRVFDVLLCGGVLLAEPSVALLELFCDGEHLVTYRDEAEMLLRIDELCREPERARALAEAGRRLVERDHRLSHRLAIILEAARARGWLEPGG
jgi:hypothetical protein